MNRTDRVGATNQQNTSGISHNNINANETKYIYYQSFGNQPPIIIFTKANHAYFS